MPRPSLYEFAGGEAAFHALAAAHHDRCLRDPVLNHPFSRPSQHPEHVRRLAAYWAEVFGGPASYSDECSTQSAMLSLHACNGAHDDFGPRFIDCFVAAMDDAGLPDDTEFRAALQAYMTWAVADVTAYFPEGSHVPAGLGMPRWSWDGLAATAR